jgi:hypothetical protein
MHAALVWLRTSPGFIGVAGIERRRSRLSAALRETIKCDGTGDGFRCAQSMLRPGMPGGEANIRR